MNRIWIGFGGLAGLTAVALAAVAAHAGLDPAPLEMLRSGVQMQGWHALALLFTGLWAPGAAAVSPISPARLSPLASSCSAAVSMRSRLPVSTCLRSPPPAAAS